MKTILLLAVVLAAGCNHDHEHEDDPWRHWHEEIVCGDAITEGEEECDDGQNDGLGLLGCAPGCLLPEDPCDCRSHTDAGVPIGPKPCWFPEHPECEEET